MIYLFMNIYTWLPKNSNSPEEGDHIENPIIIYAGRDAAKVQLIVREFLCAHRLRPKATISKKPLM